MKKSLIISVVVLLLLGIATTVNAYSTSEFEIDVPDTFKTTATNVFACEDGRNFNITTVRYDEKSGYPYTQATLDKLVNEIYTNLDSQKADIKRQMKITYGTSMSSKAIDEYVNSFKCNSIDVKEITNCTKNNYKCIHILANYAMADTSYYCDQYAIVSGSKIYTLTLSAPEKEDFNSEEMKGILDSFTIKNYKEPQDTMSPILIGAIVGAGVGVVLAIVSVIKKKKENQAQ
ncbi:MAG: hypothetical protein J5881_01340 [Clostridia bacterium]|nr:hypothetical protein [Clostridia bacterium]